MQTSRTAPHSRGRLDCVDRRPVPLHRRIHRLRITMILTSLTGESLACVDPCTAYWVFEPTLLALILLPAPQTYPDLKRRPQCPRALKYGNQPVAKSAVGMIAVDLIRRALLELRYDVVEVTAVRLDFFRCRVKGTFNPQGSFAREEAYHLPELIRITLRRRIVAESALRLSGNVEVDEMFLYGSQGL